MSEIRNSMPQYPALPLPPLPLAQSPATASPVHLSIEQDHGPGRAVTQQKPQPTVNSLKAGRDEIIAALMEQFGKGRHKSAAIVLNIPDKHIFNVKDLLLKSKDYENLRNELKEVLHFKGGLFMFGNKQERLISRANALIVRTGGQPEIPSRESGWNCTGPSDGTSLSSDGLLACLALLACLTN